MAPSGPPIRLVLPSPGAEPVSAWRPPLYPVPWALTTNDHFYLSRPIAADEVNWPVPNYRYGAQLGETNTIHTGIDIPAKFGTPVLAAGDGTVVWAGWGLFTGAVGDTKDPYGQAIAIRHDFGYQDHTLYTVYAHLSQIDVTEGQWVRSGEPIGLVGQTGFATGPHLHFEVRLDDSSFFTTRNPELWLVPPEGWGVLVGTVKSTGGLVLHYQQIILRAADNPQQFWVVYTYGPDTVHPDEYYQENLVLSDLPAGKYILQIPYFGYYFNFDIEIYPGRVTYFTYRGYRGLSTDPPPTPEPGEPTRIP
jgi:murein DD-endopeptidase MepM/ murein hydrolase activator NlpD